MGWTRAIVIGQGGQFQPNHLSGHQDILAHMTIVAQPVGSHVFNCKKNSDISYLKTSQAFDIPIPSRVLLAAVLCWLVTLL